MFFLIAAFSALAVGALRVAQAVLPAMRERGHGRRLFLSSILGRRMAPMRGAYAAVSGPSKRWSRRWPSWSAT